MGEVKEKRLPKERYYELVHFCRQYNGWIDSKNRVNSILKTSRNRKLADGRMLHDVMKEKLSYYEERINIIESTVKEANNMIYSYLLYGVTNETNYHKMLEQMGNLPYTEDVYYDSYRRFFNILNEKHY